MLKWLREPSSGDDIALWLFMPGYFFIDYEGQRKRWPRTYGLEHPPQQMFGHEDPPRWMLLATYCASLIIGIVLIALGVTCISA